MKNKAGTYFGRKVELDGYVFDSQKEADFYQRFSQPPLTKVSGL